MLLQTGQPPLNLFHHFDGIGAGLPAHIENHGGLVFVVSEAAPLGHAVLGVADIANADRRAAHVLDDDVVELRNGFHASQRSHAHLDGTAHNASAGRFDVFALQRSFDFLRGELIAVELVQIHEHVDLAVAAAADVHARHAIHGLQRAPHLLVGDLG